MEAIPGVNCINRSMQVINAGQQSLSGLGDQPTGCRWIQMGPPLGLVWVCFGGGGGYKIMKPTGLSGVSSQQLQLPYCDQLNQDIISQAIAWIQANPLLAAGIGIGLYLFLK